MVVVFIHHHTSRRSQIKRCLLYTNSEVLKTPSTCSHSMRVFNIKLMQELSFHSILPFYAVSHPRLNTSCAWSRPIHFDRKQHTKVFFMQDSTKNCITYFKLGVSVLFTTARATAEQGQWPHQTKKRLRRRPWQPLQLHSLQRCPASSSWQQPFRLSLRLPPQQSLWVS